MAKAKTTKKIQPKKITPTELEQVTTFVNAINQMQMQIGGIELQKQSALGQVTELRNGLQEVKKSLEDKYGDVSINLQDGSISASNS